MFCQSAPPASAGTALAGALDVVVGYRGLLGLGDGVPEVGLPSGSPPPTRAATSMFLISLANNLPRLASMTAFLCLVVAHLEWLLIVLPASSFVPRSCGAGLLRPDGGPDKRWVRPRSESASGGLRGSLARRVAQARPATMSTNSLCTRRSPVISDGTRWRSPGPDGRRRYGHRPVPAPPPAARPARPTERG